MKHANPNQKLLQCVSCPEILAVDRGTVWCQCSPCILSNQPRPRHADLPVTDDANQLELGEVAA